MITFKEIEMTGFKSFADETHINFDGGITAIVGPNGCGKSNVSDAIRWVLGEQSSKALRGKSMQDVIFAGTEKRRKLSYCEVSLVFDNTHKWFNTEYDEVVITRKLYRSGESEYYLNRKPCRLKDIRDILYDSGIGKDGYSIIGQGRVEEIIQSKAEERRAIFEEAAGIAKFKARKTETENRLVRVRDNLARANDILVEVERRLGPLKRQSEDAKKYLEYRDVLKNLEINAYIYQYDHAEKTKNEINVKLQGYRDNLNVLNNTYETEQAKYDKSLNEINQIDRKASELHEQVLHLSVSLEKKQSETSLLNEKTRYLREQLDRLNAEINAYQLDISQRTTLMESAIALREEERANLSKLNKEARELADKQMELLDQLTKSEGEKEENQRAMLDNLSKLGDIKANLSGYIAKRDTLADNIKNDQSKLRLIEQEYDKFKSELTTLDSEVNSLKATKITKENNIAKIKAKLADMSSKNEELNARIYALKSSISNDTNRKNILTNLQADFEGYQFAVKRLLQEGKKNSKLNSAIKGVVGNIITVDSKYQTAIEIALGGSIQNIVTKDEADAKVLINYLKEMKLGRATFLPISAVKPRSLGMSERAYLRETGCIGIASDLVKTDEVYKPVISSLLGSTVVCDTLDNAVAVARKSGYAFRIVTLEGDVLSPQGSMSGGSKKSNDSSLLNKENEIKALVKNIEDKTKELTIAESEYNANNIEINKVKGLLDSETNALQTVSGEYYSKSTLLETQTQKVDTLNENIFSLKSQITLAESIVADLNNKINSIDKIESDINSTKSKAGKVDETSKTLYEELKHKRDEYNEAMMLVKVKIASTEEKINALNTKIETNELEINNLNELLHRTESAKSGQEKIYNEIASMHANTKDDTEAENIKVRLQELNSKLASFDEFKQSLMREIKDLDDKKANISNDITKLNNKIYQEENRLQKVDIDIENMQERIYEEYEMTYNDCLPHKDQGEDFDIKETLIRINRIKNQITGLGYVNVNAIEEYKTEGARYEEMNGQIEDLRRAEEDAVNIIKQLSDEMLEKFNTEFVKIQENFTKVFKELFGGGNARLELLPNEDPLSAGVEIIAQPPGKVLQQISLLSGGEKTMTAIAILFAILKLRPMPFCFLDEIEAALDDANIERYARYLKRFSDDTQFIVITHRKPTMELADSLYGVTMEEKGVSKTVSVKLADAVKAVENNEE